MQFRFPSTRELLGCAAVSSAHGSTRILVALAALAISLGARAAEASRLSDMVTAGEHSVSNGLQLALDLAAPFTLEGGWSLYEADTGKINTFNLGAISTSVRSSTSISRPTSPRARTACSPTA
jgi:hypothetical protein